MSEEWVVRGEGVWKRFCRNLRQGTMHVLADSARAFFRVKARGMELGPGEFWSLRDVSFQVARGESLAVIGRNGSGKTTLLKLMAGVLAPDSGELRTRGRVVSLIMIGAGFHPLLSGRENIYIYGGVLGLERQQVDARMEAIVAFAGLPDGALDSAVKHYSKGMYVRLAFSVAVHVDPDVLLIDEVLAVGDAGFRETCIARLAELRASGCSLVIVSHSAGNLRRLAERALWLEGGEVVAYGPSLPILERYTQSLQERVATLEAPTSEPDDVAPKPARPGAPSRVRLADLVVPECVAHEACVVTATLTGLHAVERPELTLELLRDDRVVASSRFATPPRRYPALGAGDVWGLRFELRARVRGGSYTLRLACDDGGERCASLETACEVQGRSVTGALSADLQEAFDEPSQAEPSGWVLPGAEVPVALDAQGASGTWELRGADGALVAQALVSAPNGAGAWPLRGRFVAHLPPGRYRQAFVPEGSEPILGAALIVAARAQPVGLVDPAGWAWVEGRDEPSVEIKSPEGLALRGLSLRAGDALAPVLETPEAPRFATTFHPRDAGRSTFLVPGARCAIDLELFAGTPLDDVRLLLRWVRVGDEEPSGGAAYAIEHLEAGSCAARFDVACNLAPGEYRLDVVARARGLELDQKGVCCCHVLGPEGRHGDGRVEELGVTESETKPGVPALAPRSADAQRTADERGMGRRAQLEALCMNPEQGPETVAPAGDPHRVCIRVALEEGLRPGLKFAWVTSGEQRNAARVNAGDQLAPGVAGERRDVDYELIHHLPGGAYWLQGAVVDREAEVTLDARWRAHRCLVPQAGQACGAARLDATLVVSPQALP